MNTSEAVLTCDDCAAGLEHCHDVSIEHADGTTECFDPECTVAHAGHAWQLLCSALTPPCPCSPEEHLGWGPWVDGAVPQLEAA